MKTLSLLAAVLLVACQPASLPEPRSESEEHAHPHGAMVRWSQRLSADGTVPANALVRMKRQRDQMLQAQQVLDVPSLLTNWQSVGPGNVGGRIRSICIHPTQPSTMWIGSVGGGIFKTVDGGASWQPLDDFAPVMSVGCMVLDPKDPKHLYAGTGEGFFDTVAGSSILAASRGAGIFQTSDGGQTWGQLPSTTGADFHFVNRIAISPVDNKVLLIAAGGGLFRSSDAGASFAKSNSEFVMDVDFHPTDGMLAVAGVRNGLPKFSVDGGVSWASATGIAQKERVEVTYSQSNPNIVYASVSQAGRITVYRSTDGGQSYTLRTSGTGIQTWSRYNNVVWVDPSDSNTLLLGGVYLYRSTDAGQSFTRSDAGGHADYHVITEHPDYNGTTNQTVFHGSDGGVFKTSSFKASSLVWQELNNKLSITQFYGAAMAPNGTIIGGTQDNGTIRYTGNTESWVRKIGGDGCYCAADPTDSNYVYGQVYWIRIYRSSNGGQSFSRIATSSNIKDQGSNFIPHIKLDPNDPNRMYFAGASLWRSDAVRTGTPTWKEVKLALPCRDAHFRQDPPCNISIIEVADGNPNIVWVGHNHGDIYMTTNALAATPTWKKVDIAAQPNRWVGSISIDPRDHSKVYVGFLGYHNDNVWLTTNSGSAWQQISGTGAGALPETPVNWITVHPSVAGCLFAGTDIGLYYSADDGATWKTTVAGASSSPVAELQWKNNRTLMVVTHGRGIFTVDVAEPASVTNIGGGCGLSSPPVLTASSPVLGGTHSFSLSSTVANAQVALMIGVTTSPKVIGNGCTLQLDPIGTGFVQGSPTNGTGAWSYSWMLPAQKDLIGAKLTTQALVVSTGGPALGLAELSNGLELVAGL